MCFRQVRRSREVQSPSTSICLRPRRFEDVEGTGETIRRIGHPGREQISAVDGYRQVRVMGAILHEPEQRQHAGPRADVRLRIGSDRRRRSGSSRPASPGHEMNTRQCTRRGPTSTLCIIRIHYRAYDKPLDEVMNFVSVRELRSRSAAVWQALDEERHLVITSNGKPIALLSATSPETFDETLAALRQAEALRAIESMQQSAREAGADRLFLGEINAEIAAVRQRRLE